MLFAKERTSHLQPKVHLLGMLVSKTAQQDDLQQVFQLYLVSGPGHGSEEMMPFFPTDLVDGDRMLGQHSHCGKTNPRTGNVYRGERKEENLLLQRKFPSNASASSWKSYLTALQY